MPRRSACISHTFTPKTGFLPSKHHSPFFLDASYTNECTMVSGVQWSEAKNIKKKQKFAMPSLFVFVFCNVKLLHFKNLMPPLGSTRYTPPF